jgi:hypothetical protein
MTGHGSKFGRKKEEAIAALLTQRNRRRRPLDWRPKTLLRRIEEPEFESAYGAARRVAFSIPMRPKPPSGALSRSGGTGVGSSRRRIQHGLACPVFAGLSLHDFVDRIHKMIVWARSSRHSEQDWKVFSTAADGAIRSG